MNALFLVVICAARAAAGPSGSADAHAAPTTGFPAAYLGMVERSLQADPAYGSRLLDAFELHLRSVAAMTSPRAVADYLELAVLGAGTASVAALQSSLGYEALEPLPAAALLLAHALARPAQFHETLDGLESRRAGLGKHAAQLLREVKGAGDKRLIRMLRSQGGGKSPSRRADL